MWVDAQHDSCPAEYRWHPLLNILLGGHNNTSVYGIMKNILDIKVIKLN